METMKYKVIKSRKQYNDYTKTLEQYVFADKRTKQIEEEIELLTLLIEKYDQEHNTFNDLDPVALIKALLEQHNEKPKELSEALGVSKGLVSDILSYKKGLSKEVIRKLAEHFSMRQEAFNRPYKLQTEVPKTKKKLELA